MYKIIGVDQRIYGPVTADQIRQWLAEGRLNAASLAQIDGAPDWKPLSVFPEFIPPPIMAPSRPPMPAAHDSATSLATTGLILGVLSNFCCCFGFMLAIAGLICSIIALQRTQGSAYHSARPLAWAGLGLSILGLFTGFFLPFISALGRRWYWHSYRWHTL